MKILADRNIPFAAECFSSIGDVEVAAGRQMTGRMTADADVLLVRSVTKVNSELLAGSKVQFVGTATIGFEHIDVEYLKQNNIGFASAPGSNANSVAEYIVAALLEAAKKHNIKLKGKSIGIIGAGNVGSRVGKKCAALGMKVHLNDPPLQRQKVSHGDIEDRMFPDGWDKKEYVPIEKMYDCDFVTLHTPLTYDGQDKTYHLANQKFFESLKNGCMFINTSRGGVVDTAALKKAIKTGKLRSAVLDVWEDEPGIDTELLEMTDIGTAHIAGYSLDGKIAGMIMIYKALCKHFALETKYDIDSFLPAPAVPELKINPKRHPEQEILRAAVEEVYNIKEDDGRLRLILNMPLGKRCATFDKLRREYPVRREFQNTKIEFATENTEEIKKKLEGIGFKVKG